MLGLILLIAAVATENSVDAEFIQENKDNERVKNLGVDIPAGGTSAAAGWLIFLAIVLMPYEIIVILQRFINIKIINSNILIVIIVVSEI